MIILFCIVVGQIHGHGELWEKRDHNTAPKMFAFKLWHKFMNFIKNTEIKFSVAGPLGIPFRAGVEAIMM
jgi:hypothetical protein